MFRKKSKREWRQRWRQSVINNSLVVCSKKTEGGGLRQRTVFSRSTGCSHRTPPRCRCCSTPRWGWRSTCCRKLGGAGRTWSCPVGRPPCWCPSAERWWWCHSSPAPASCQRCASGFLERSCRTGTTKQEEFENKCISLKIQIFKTCLDRHNTHRTS